MFLKLNLKKCDDIWNNETCSGRYLPFSLGLSSWDDTEPKSIAEILGINEVDWSKVPVDSKILVSYDGIDWNKRYFAKYENGYVYAWCYGATSWSEEDTFCWNYAKLAEEIPKEPKKEKEPTINLDGLEKGTLIKVSSDGEHWYVRPFEGMKKKKVVTKEGKTSRQWIRWKFLDDDDLAFYNCGNTQN